MDLQARIKNLTPEMIGWRHHLHAHPELAYQEKETSHFVADKLGQFGFRTHQAIGGTGVVAVLGGGSGPSVGLRADMDALPILEATGLSYASKIKGVMHACGHDGHTAMLLGAARILSEAPPPQGTVVFIFQPAEEGEAGARAMIADGLFDDFPVSSVYGLHNWPGIAEGQFAVRPGAMMAAFDTFEVIIRGLGSHAAMPHQGTDPIAVSSQLYQAWQLIVSRNVDATDSVVISVTQVHAGDAWNVIPDTLVLRGTVRTLTPDTRRAVRRQMSERSELIGKAFDVTIEFKWHERYPATVNTHAEANIAREAAFDTNPDKGVMSDFAPSMASEDFAYMLNVKPGAYTWLGAGSVEGGKNLHSPHYDFNDRLLPIGVEFWVRLAHSALKGTKQG